MWLQGWSSAPSASSTFPSARRWSRIRGRAQPTWYLDVKINRARHRSRPKHRRSQPVASTNSFNAHGELKVGDQSYEVYRLSAVEGSDTLPYSLKVLLENLLRTEDGANITADHIRALGAWDETADPDTEIQFTPARVLMHDFTGVPCVVDLATMREAIKSLGGDPAKVNPLAPAELVIDHSVVADIF